MPPLQTNRSGLGGGKDEQAKHRGFLGKWKYYVWYNNGGYMLFTHLSTPTECKTPRGNPIANYGLQVITMCQCTIISYNTWTTLVGDVAHRETMHVAGGREYMENTCTFWSMLLWT